MALLCIGATLVPAGLTAASYYVSPAGAPSGSGSIDHPWDLYTAVRHPLIVKPGDTIYLREGTYITPDRLVLHVYLKGSSGQYITVRPWNNERVRIDGGLQIHNPWVIFRDLEVMNSRPVRQSAQTGPWPTDVLRPAGFDIMAPDVKVINNVVHDTSTGISSWKNAGDNDIYGNIVYYNGWKAPDRGHGHGLYMQNQYGSKYIADNIVFNQFDQGLQIYGTSSTFLNNFTLEGNIVFNNGVMSGRYSRNILVGGTTVANNPILKDNYTWYPTSWNHGGDNNLGYYASGAGCTNLVFEDNYFVSGGVGLTLHKCSASRFKGNTVFGELRNFAPSTYAQNTWLLRNRPTGNRVFVRPNRYETGRAHIAVFNWSRAAAVSVDLSGIGLSQGDRFEIRDAQNYYGAPVYAGSYSDAAVMLPMTGSAVAQAVGNVPVVPAHTDMEFGAFIVLRTDSTDPVPQQLAIGDFTTSGLTTNSAVLSWTTNRPATPHADYGTSIAYGSTTGANTHFATTHTTTLTGLAADTRYYVRVTAEDDQGETAVATRDFKTQASVPLPESVPLRITAADLGQITSESALISWSTNVAATSKVEFGPDTRYGSVASDESTLRTSHSVKVAGLLPATMYYVRISGGTSAGSTVQASLSFSTVSVPQKPAPPPSVYSSWMEAENGVRVGFPIVNDTTVSGRKYIYSQHPEFGYVVYNVYVPADGRYYFWFRALALTEARASVYVSIDGAAEDIFDVGYRSWSPEWQWSQLNGRSAQAPLTSNPRSFQLKRGWHKLNVRSRQAGTTIDGFVVTNDPSLTPTDGSFTSIR